MSEQDTATTVEKDDALVVTEVDAKPDDETEFEPLFGDDPTEAELMGEEETPAEEKPADSEPKGDEKPEDKESEKKPKEPEKTGETKDKEGDEKADKKDDEKPDEKPAEESEKDAEPDYSKPPPKGFVPLPAIQKERRVNSELRTALTQANAEIAKLKEDKPVDSGEFKDFKELSDNEFAELQDDDPDEASRYLYKYNRYKIHKAEQAITDRAEKEKQRQERVVIANAGERIETAVPGIADEGNEIGNILVDFAVKQGFNEGYLALLTEPQTRIIHPETGESYVLGDGAASLVEMVYKFHQMSESVDTEKVRSEVMSEVEKAVEQRIRKEVTEELMAKLKNEPGADFRSLDDVPGAEKTPEKKAYTEAEFALLSSKEQERLLMET